MTDEILKNAKANYEYYQNEKKKKLDTLKLATQYYAQLHDDSLVDLMEGIRQEFLSERDIVFDSFSFFPFEELKSDIYVCVGAYIRHPKTYRPILVPKQAQAEYFVYRSIEFNLCCYFISACEREQFEKDHLIIFIDTDTSLEEMNNNYDNIRYLYFQELLRSETYQREEIFAKVKSKCQKG